LQLQDPDQIYSSPVQIQIQIQHEPHRNRDRDREVYLHLTYDRNENLRCNSLK
jgi:hypothetical protein